MHKWKKLHYERLVDIKNDYKKIERDAFIKGFKTCLERIDRGDSLQDLLQLEEMMVK